MLFFHANDFYFFVLRSSFYSLYNSAEHYTALEVQPFDDEGMHCQIALIKILPVYPSPRFSAHTFQMPSREGELIQTTALQRNMLL